MSVLRALLRMHLFSTLQGSKLVPFLPHFARVFWRLMNDARVSKTAKIAPFLVVAPLLSPPAIRLYFIPALGIVGWLVMGTLAIKVFIWLCPPDVVREHVARVARGE
jgi:hypothetical protein